MTSTGSHTAEREEHTQIDCQQLQPLSTFLTNNTHSSPYIARSMKITNPEELKEHQYAVAVGGAKGALAGLAAALPATYIANKRWPYFRALPPSLKALGTVIVVVPSFVISAEHASREFEKEQWSRTERKEIDIANERRQRKWEDMAPTDKMVDFAARHQWSLIASCWAAGLAGAFGYIMRDPYQSTSQKVVQARMWSQGMTIGLVLAAAAISRTRAYRRDESDVRAKVNLDHSWQDAIKFAEENKSA